MSTISIKRLWDLQQLDWEIADRERSLAEALARLADDSAIGAAKQHIEQTESQLSEREVGRRKLESAVRPLEEKLKTMEDKLYSASITTQREFSAYEAERTHLQEQRATEEDKLLELMMEIDDLQSGRDETRRLLQRLEPERETEVKALREREAQLVADLAGLRESRGEITPDIPGPFLSVYDSLRKTRAGHAVAIVERSMCQACRVALPTMELQRARTAQGIVQCSSCRRILYAE